MAKSIFRAAAPLLCVVTIAWAGDRALLGGEDERRWNTPPELIPEQFMKTNDVKNERSLTIPITTSINVNAGSNAHSLGFQVGPEGISYSESNSFNRPLSQSNGVSQSQSVSFSAGLTGIAGAVSEASSQHHPIYGNQGNANNQALGFGIAAASSSGTVQNGHVATSAASSVGSVHSSASSGSSQGMNIRFPDQSHNRPIWTNIRPNHNNNGHQPTRMPKLDIEVKPHREPNRKPIMLVVSAPGPRWETRQPKIEIHKWHPTYRMYYDDEQR
ncbi:uncharacterized protein LOC108628874 [Ceratina calcarata]|uniref:Uncharacterized protein LOC108628874 n=1 Tax=Ceratina calcarata TaxID=156304 RepID=A0AAJ7J898_9HYME|nr:uncharacterized protein LOC108628874 [Ceratina calcarata]XP_026672594.1 uncharacterized protein LOC108628874 [Ceratina calcarata]